MYHPVADRAALRRRMLALAPQRPDEAITGRVIQSGRTLRVAEVTREFVHTEMKPEYWPYLDGVASIMIAPLRLRRSVIGHITLMRDAGTPVAARDEFLSIASHELRTPLTALRLALENMRRVSSRDALEKLSPEYVERVLVTAERQGHRLESLVAALLDVSRIQMGKLELDVEEVDLASIVFDAAASLEDEARQTGSTIAVRGEPVRGYWDRLRISQVATNLLSNAVKYGAGRPVEVEFGPVGEGARLTVRDHGIGIEPDDQPQIFERFERAVSSRNYGGLGLGLYIVKRIVEAHAGTVAVDSKPGEGSEFAVHLPLRPAVAVRGALREQAAR